MKKYKVTYKTEQRVVKKKRKNFSINKELYYDVDGKICFRVKIYEELSEVLVTLRSDADYLEIINSHFKDATIISIDFKSEFTNQFECVAASDYYTFEKMKNIKKTFLEERDSECNEEVQIEYNKDKEGMLNQPIIYSEW